MVPEMALAAFTTLRSKDLKIAVKVFVTTILLVVLMASHLIYSRAFGKSFKLSHYLHSNATCHQMSA